ncbi:PIN domain-containing protein [Dehalococcoides mccartyi]|nr:PIN domain-containing protein [Dehalococcoides mccartyi]
MTQSDQIALVDTDVFSYIWKKDSRADQYLSQLEGLTAAISFQTVAELLFGAYKRGFGKAKLDSLQNEIRRYYTVPFNIAVIDHWARVRAELSAFGQMIDDRDLWIAATALALGAPILTHNRRHFDRIAGLVVISHAP